MSAFIVIAACAFSAAAAFDTKITGVNFLASRAPANATVKHPVFLSNTSEAEGADTIYPSTRFEDRLGLTANEMEEAVVNLMLGKTEFGATPMGGSVRKIIDLVKKVMEPKVLAASRSDERQLETLASEINKCQSERHSSLRVASRLFTKYKKESSLHKQCRSNEATMYTTKESCKTDQKSLHTVKQLKCKAYAAISNTWGTTKHNAAIIEKGGGESVESYITRLSTTFCGKHSHGRKGRTSRRGGWGGGLDNGMLDQYLKAKDACARATKAWSAKVKQCKRAISAYSKAKGSCNQFQLYMDSASCQRAVVSKDACESFAGCYFNKKAAYKVSEAKVRYNVIDRKAEWRGLKRIGCLIDAFADGKVTNNEVDTCRNATISTSLLDLDYPTLPALKRCVVPNLYPTTELYKKQEFAPLPAVAKGKDSFECSGMEEISLTPNEGSPSSCKCERVTMNGHYSAGPLVKCKNCLDVSKSTQKNSCPVGTKIFSPASKQDWKTFLKSAQVLRDPHFIVDVTRPQNGCGGCTRSPMNSGSSAQSSWRTSDGSAWWLRSTKYGEPNGDYTANCYLRVKSVKNENLVTFNDQRCTYHSRSYYCQKEKMDLTPGPGSPSSCRCTRVILTGAYSAGSLVKCENCLDVRKTTQKNSCPSGMKIFSPRTRSDWRTFLKSAGPLKAPNWIIDISRPHNGCAGCTKSPMRSTQASQATWRTSDGSPWWLRSTKYSEPNGDYNANCYLGVRGAHDENSVTFNDQSCSQHSSSYYCQPKVKLSAKKDVVTVKRDPPVMVASPSLLKSGLLEYQYYFSQNGKCNTGSNKADMVRTVGDVNYRDTRGKWSGWSKTTQFAARWEGILIIADGGKYTMQIASDDGSMLYIGGKVVVSNDGYHSWRTKTGDLVLKPSQHKILAKYFQGGGSAGMQLSYRGPDTDNKMKAVPQSVVKHLEPGGFKEEVFYMARSVSHVSQAIKGTPRQVRIVPNVGYSCTNRAFPGFGKKDLFAARFTGTLKVTQGGSYRFQTRSDDGSVLYVGGKKVVDNDRPHGFRSRTGDIRLSSNSETELKLLYFENYGGACVYLLYMGEDTGHKLKVINWPVVKASV